MRNSKGFTLVEMVVGMILMGIMGMVAASFFVFTTKSTTEIRNEIEEKVDDIIAERILLKDLKYSEPSFNNLLVKDDLGYNFFDYLTDVEDSSLVAGPRKLTLEPGRRTEFLFIITNDKLGGTMMYSPVLAYDVGAPPANPNMAATLTFKSLNKGGELAKTKPGFWSPGVALMLDTPAAVRRLTALGPDYSVPTRSPVFVGLVTGPGETRLAELPISNFVNRTNPLYPDELIRNEDEFLRNVPPMGGAAALVRLKAVTIVKYFIAQDPKTKVLLFYRSVFDGKGFSQGQLFAKDIHKVVFSRKSARDPLVYYAIDRVKK